MLDNIFQHLYLHIRLDKVKLYNNIGFYLLLLLKSISLNRFHYPQKLPFSTKGKSTIHNVYTFSTIYIYSGNGTAQTGSSSILLGATNSESVNIKCIVRILFPPLLQRKIRLMKNLFFSISGRIPMAAKKLHLIVMLAIIGSVLLGNDVNPAFLSRLCDWDFSLQNIRDALPRV